MFPSNRSKGMEFHPQESVKCVKAALYSLYHVVLGIGKKKTSRFRLRPLHLNTPEDAPETQHQRLPSVLIVSWITSCRWLLMESIDVFMRSSMSFRSIVIISIHRDLVHAPRISAQHFMSFPLSKIKERLAQCPWSPAWQATDLYVFYLCYHITVFEVSKKTAPRYIWLKLSLNAMLTSNKHPNASCSVTGDIVWGTARLTGIKICTPKEVGTGLLGRNLSRSLFLAIIAGFWVQKTWPKAFMQGHEFMGLK